MLNYYPHFLHIMEEFKNMSGGQSGILQGIFAPIVKIPPEPYLKLMTCNMPYYHKLTFNDPHKDVQYHISGYGIYNEEAFVKLLGESVERYAPIITESIFRKQAVYASYNEIKNKGKALPLEYINIFSIEQQKTIHSIIPSYSENYINDDEIISWISCPSLLYPGENIWIPLQLMFVGYVKDVKKKENCVTPSFSTGTAAHRTVKKALLNSIIEYIQIDSFILSWYTERKCKQIKIDDPVILSILENVGLGTDCPYEITPFYTTLQDLDLPTVMVAIKKKNTNFPNFIIGVQGDLDIRNAIVRGIFEAAAIISMNIYGIIYDTNTVFFANKNSAFADLDTNVFYYGAPENNNIVNRILNNLSGEKIALSLFKKWNNISIDDQLAHLIHQLKGISQYAVYLDITPPELHKKNWSVIRTLIPELCGMCFPGFPFLNHPRMKKYGDVTNGYPHPLP